MTSQPPLEPLYHKALLDKEGVRHGFFTRQGGVSSGLYTSLNSGLGSSDERRSVLENRDRMRAHLGGMTFLTVHQHHSALAVFAESPWEPNEAPRADAIVTKTPGLAICAQAADCGPVLFADAKARVIGAAHAGWKGALGGVLEATLSLMEEQGAQRSTVTAVLGPCISQRAYEVGPEFVDRFTKAEQSNARFFIPSERTGHSMFDLPGYIVKRLEHAGVAAHALGRCTYGEPDLFFSYRRAVHKNEPDYGRLASAIMLA